MSKTKKKSLQQIGDFYISRGFRSGKLRAALAEDEEYQKLLKEKKCQLAKSLSVSSLEEREYVLPTDIDYEILSSCKRLEKKKLSVHDKVFVQLIKSQLKEDWRAPLVTALNKLLKKYK